MHTVNARMIIFSNLAVLINAVHNSNQFVRLFTKLGSQQAEVNNTVTDVELIEM
jgi:hypothetical protein